MENQKKIILKDKQIIKFSLYGFLKNLQFFEAYLIIYLTSNSISLFEIGILIAIREIIVNIFEVPSGLLADYFGKKKELCLCFVMYIISFVFFFFSKNFGIAILAMVFFGLGEAFRSGTHKAMIFAYLEKKGWTAYKTFVYGKTRSLSKIGSAISAILGIIIILNVPSNGYIFLAAIVPYILDLILILTYPKYLDKGVKEAKITFKEMFHELAFAFKGNKELRHILIGEGAFEGTIKSIKDYIQPVLELVIVGSGIILITSMDAEDNLKIILGITYMFFNLFGSLASRTAYHLTNHKLGSFWLNTFYVILIIAIGVIGIVMNCYYIVIICYIIIYLAQNFRKPIYIDVLDDNMPKKDRATVLSIGSQVTSIFVIILSPIIGWVSDSFGIKYAMFGLSVLLLILLPFIISSGSKKTLIKI